MKRMPLQMIDLVLQRPREQAGRFDFDLLAVERFCARDHASWRARCPP